MDMLFTKVLNMSISTSWLVLVVLALRFLLKKSPKWVHVALWALVAVRLICPWSPESELSLVPEKTTEHMVQSLSGGYYGDAMIYSQGSWEYDAAVAAGVAPSVGDNNYHYVLTQPDDPTKPAHTAAAFFGQIWIVGMVMMFAWALISYFRLKKKVSASLDVGNGIFLCDYIDTPFILGIVRPKIYLPSAMEPDSASHVLAHERAHIARKDHWWKPLGYLLLTVHWFNPLMWLAYVLLCRDIELACDEKVITPMALPQRKSYSEALLKCSVSRRNIAACPLAFGEVGVKERVKTVLNYKKPAFWIVLIGILALIVTAVCFLTDPKTEEPETTDPSGESPYAWASTIREEELYHCAASLGTGDWSADPLGSEQLRELVELLNQVPEDQFVSKKPEGQYDPRWNFEGVNVHLFMGQDHYILLRYVEDTVMIDADSDSPSWDEDGNWVIENQALKDWLRNLSYGGSYMLSEENREEIRQLLKVDYVEYFSPQEFGNQLFIGCVWDNDRGHGVACFEKEADGYKLLKLIRGADVKTCASGSKLYYCDFNDLRLFLVMNSSVTAMEWIGMNEKTILVETPGLVVEYFPEGLAAEYRFRYKGGTTMYMDRDNNVISDNREHSLRDPRFFDELLKVASLDAVTVGETVDVDEYYRQNSAMVLDQALASHIWYLLSTVPDSAVEPATELFSRDRYVALSFRHDKTGEYDSIQLALDNGCVYYSLIPRGTGVVDAFWKIDYPELTTFIDDLFERDRSDWEVFAEYPISEGQISFEAHGVKVSMPKLRTFEYELTENGIRFRPWYEESWVEVQYHVEPFAVCGTGLKTFEVVYGGHSGTKGVYDNNDYWSFMDLKPTQGDVAYNIVLLNEDTWVEEFEDELIFLLKLMSFEVNK